MSDPISLSANGQSSADQYVVIARRYRPQTFDELVGQEHVARALQQAIASDRVGHAYLFTGARGVGKTSAARILAKALNCERGPTPTPCNECEICQYVSSGDDIDVLEIDGASNNGVDEVRELRQNAAVRPTRTRYKIYIIDEVHMLSKSAFNALLKTLEEPPEHVKFIFATTEPHKIPITILSRCQRFDFAGIGSSAIQSRLAQIAAVEGVQIDQDALQILASRAAGSMRDSQSLLEQLLASGKERITADDVTQLLGIAPAERLSGLVQHLVTRQPAAALAELDATLAGGVEVGLLLDQLIGYFRDVMAAAVGCSPDQMLYALPSQADEIAQTGRELGLPTILAIGQILDQTASRMRISVHGRTLVEMAVVRICQLDELEEIAAVVAELRGNAPQDGLGSGARAGVAKKNAELGPAVQFATEQPVSRRNDPPHGTRGSADVEREPAGRPGTRQESVPGARHRDEPGGSQVFETTSSTASADSVVAQWQRAMSDNTPARPSGPARPSRREQLAAIAEQPFVRRAAELFDVPPDKIRYTPPDGEST